jgi:hypothetical protein
MLEATQVKHVHVRHAYSFRTINATGCKVDNEWCISHLVHIKITIYKFKCYVYAGGNTSKRCAC